MTGPARQRIRPGTRIVSWTGDCFDGAVRTADDLPSRVMAPGHDNPQTGPFHVEGAEPGDTVAVQLLAVEPARDYAVSSFSPGFGALVGTDRTAMLGPDFPETTWRYDEDAARVAFKAMVGWVRAASGLSEVDAYQFVSQNARAPIVQLVDPEYTVLVKLAKRRLPAPGR